MVAVGRRAFLVGCGAIGIGSISAGLPITWKDVEKLATETPISPGDGILVLVTLIGGNDGLNTLIPYRQSTYYDARSDLAYAAEEVLDIDGNYGLNPGMTGLAQRFRDGSLAIVRGAGYPDQDRSHFRSMDIWQTGSVDNEVTTGWIGRWLDLDNGHALRAVNIGSVLPTLAIGSKRTAATLDLRHLTINTDDVELMSALAETDTADRTSEALVRDSYRAAADASVRLDTALRESGSSAPPEQSQGDSGLSKQLDVVSRCIRAGLGTRVYSVSINGFDTHADEKWAQQRLLRTVDKSISKFLDEMAGDQNGKNVVVMAYSEFGRRVAANASDGTDHGTSGPVFIIGEPVRGGFYGDDPSLTDLAYGDLKTTTDFRDVYAELLGTTLGTDPDPVVGAKRKPLGFLT